jgi:ribosomal protein S18 acetylase RimI-like enzyme
MPIAFRQALDQDFDYCRRLYFGEMDWIIEALQIDRAAQAVSFRQQWDRTEVRIILFDGADAGWFQTRTQEDGVFIRQIIVDRLFQRRGIGTETMKRLIDEAARANQSISLDVVKINPALRLYARLGFEIIGEEERKFNMRRNP